MVEAAGVEPTYPYTIFNIINWLIFSGDTAGIPSAYFHGKFVPKILKHLVKVGVIDGAIFSTDLLLVIIPSCHHFTTTYFGMLRFCPILHPIISTLFNGYVGIVRGLNIRFIRLFIDIFRGGPLQGDPYRRGRFQEGVLGRSRTAMYLRSILPTIS
jgi:hypothetical protein